MTDPVAPATAISFAWADVPHDAGCARDRPDCPCHEAALNRFVEDVLTATEDAPAGPYAATRDGEAGFDDDHATPSALLDRLDPDAVDGATFTWDGATANLTLRPGPTLTATALTGDDLATAHRLHALGSPAAAGYSTHMPHAARAAIELWDAIAATGRDPRVPLWDIENAAETLVRLSSDELGHLGPDAAAAIAALLPHWTGTVDDAIRAGIATARPRLGAEPGAPATHTGH